MSDLHKRKLAVPFFTQRDNTYIWQQLDEDDIPFGPKYPMTWRSCNICFYKFIGLELPQKTKISGVTFF